MAAMDGAEPGTESSSASGRDGLVGRDGLDRRSIPGKRYSPAWAFLGGVLLASDRTTEKWFGVDFGGDHRREGFARSVTRIGEPQYLLVPAVALYFSGRRNRAAALDAATAAADASIITTALKGLTGKERPSQSGGRVRYHGPSTRYQSFPSGHSTVAWSSATVLGGYYPRYKLLFYAAAGAVGWSRIRLREHFLSDVAGGAAVGVASGRRVLRHGHGFFDFRF